MNLRIDKLIDSILDESDSDDLFPEIPSKLPSNIKVDLEFPSSGKSLTGHMNDPEYLQYDFKLVKKNLDQDRILKSISIPVVLNKKGKRQLDILYHQPLNNWQIFNIVRKNNFNGMFGFEDPGKLLKKAKGDI